MSSRCDMTRRYVGARVAAGCFGHDGPPATKKARSAGQAEDPLRRDIPQDLRRAAGDREATGEQHLVDVGSNLWIVRQRLRTEQVDDELRGRLPDLDREQLRHTRFRTRTLAGQRAQGGAYVQQ